MADLHREMEVCRECQACAEGPYWSPWTWEPPGISHICLHLSSCLRMWCTGQIPLIISMFVWLCPQIWPYVNGALYNILYIPSVRQEAKEMVRWQKQLHLHGGNRHSLFWPKTFIWFVTTDAACTGGEKRNRGLGPSCVISIESALIKIVKMTVKQLSRLTKMLCCIISIASFCECYICSESIKICLCKHL